MNNNDTFFNLVIQDLTDTNADVTLERAVFKARATVTLEELESVKTELAHLRAVLASDTALQELFDEVEEKMEADHEIA